MTFFLGVDPGANGAAVLITHAQQVAGVLKFKGATEKDICDWFAQEAQYIDLFAVIERVHAMPNQGVASTFKFGQSYGFLRGMLIAHGVSFEAVTPGVWQRKLGCLSKGDKNVTKSAAQELFVHQKITHAVADAFLIAEFARRQEVRN